MKLALLVCALAVAASAGASASRSSSSLPAPAGLHAFVHRAGEPVKADHTYAQLPAFAWGVVQGATGYELQLATNASFNDGSTLVDRKGLPAPVTSIQLQLPWMTGRPYALWVRVRASRDGRVSAWSKPFGFNTAWQDVPAQEPAPAGLVRWSPVAGATAYEVWFPEIGARFRTLTNVADEREFWTLRQQHPQKIEWRVRAVRYVQDAALPDKIQVTTFGPYSPTFTSSLPSSLSDAGISGRHAISNVDSTPMQPGAEALMPGFAWSGSLGIHGEAGSGLFRVYVFSDRGCVNSVTVGSIVGGPAWAPRAGPPLVLPADDATMAQLEAGGPFTYGAQGDAIMRDGTPIETSEEAFSAGAANAASGGASTGSSGGSAGPASDSSQGADAGTIALPDNGAPSGRYWWTVVPVAARPAADGSGYVYADLEQPQDACAAGRVWPFGMRSTPVVTQGASPLASGLAGTRVVSSAASRPSFSELPVVTWQPALGAQSYELQLSRQRYPWKAVRTVVSVVPSASLPLRKTDLGVWYYRVRGVNGNLPGTANKLTWSKPVSIRITGDRFVIGS